MKVKKENIGEFLYHLWVGNMLQVRFSRNQARKWRLMYKEALQIQ